jgi:hypothetical protein
LLEFLTAVVAGASAWLLLGPEYRELWDFTAKNHEDPILETDPMTNARGRVLAVEPGTAHPLWVEIRGERWKAESLHDLAAGAEVEILQLDGLVAQVRPSRAPSSAAPIEQPGRLTRPRALGFFLWPVAALFCWLSFGNLFWALILVPLIYLALLAPALM